MAEGDNPEAKQPAVLKPGKKTKHRFPNIIGAARSAIALRNHGVESPSIKKKLRPTDHQTIARGSESAPRQLAVGPECFAQSFVVEDEGI